MGYDLYRMKVAYTVLVNTEFGSHGSIKFAAIKKSHSQTRTLNAIPKLKTLNE